MISAGGSGTLTVYQHRQRCPPPGGSDVGVLVTDNGTQVTASGTISISGKAGGGAQHRRYRTRYRHLP